MSDKVKMSVVILRIALGFLFLYAGINKLMTPEWTAAGYLKGAKTLPQLYQWLSMPQNIGWVNILNVWGQILIGLSLVSGAFVYISSLFGIMMMILYYLPILKFPYVGTHSFLVDEHIIYILLFILFKSADAGKYAGLDSRLSTFFVTKKRKLKT